MKNIVVWVIVTVAVLAGGFYFFNGYIDNDDAAGSAATLENGTYMIDGQAVTLVGGTASVAAAPGSASMVTTTYFGNVAKGDLNGDGVDDAALILTQTTGGSGTFYYVAAALATSSGFVGTNAVLLGDRIAPQTTEIRDGKVIANYADRSAGEPMTAQPSVGVTKTLKIENGTLTVVQ